MITLDRYRSVNGMSNKYWGWGWEDDEFYLRLKDANIVIDRPTNLSTNVNDTFRNLHDKTKYQRDSRKSKLQAEQLRRRDRITGLSTLKYYVQQKINASINNIDFTIVNVELYCNLNVTPWCKA